MTPRLSSPASVALLLALGPFAFCVGCDQPTPVSGSQDGDGGSGAAPGPGGQGSDEGQTRKRPPFWTEEAAKNPYELKEWYGDFPYPPEMPKVVRPGRWYDKSSGQALQTVVNNLIGTCSQNAWLMAKEFFDRHQAEASDLLIEAMDRGLTEKGKSDLALNVVKVMGRMRNPVYADALVRATEYSNPSIRSAAMRAMRKGGSPEAVLKVRSYYNDLSRMERLDWVKACIGQLSDEQLMPIVRDLLTRQELIHSMRTPAMEELLKLPPKRAAKFLKGVWKDFPTDLRVSAAGIMHAAGDPEGTHELRLAIRKANRTLKAVAVVAAAGGKVEPLLDDILELTNITSGPEVEKLAVAVITTIEKVPGERVHNTLLVYTAARDFRVRQAAYQAMNRRGETKPLDELVQVAKTATGLRQTNAIADLMACRYEKVVPILVAQYEKANSKTKIRCIRNLAMSGTKGAFGALRDIFMSEEHKLPTKLGYTNVTFLGIHFSNLHESYKDVILLLKSLPRKDYRRRGALVHALANVAGARREEPWVEEIYDALRELVFDRGEVPQVRMLALEYLRKDIGLSDAMKLKRGLRKESPQMRRYLSDHLFEFF